GDAPRPWRCACRRPPSRGLVASLRPPAAPLHPLCDPCRVPQALVRLARRSLLGLLLGAPGPPPVLDPGQIDRGGELLLVVRPSLLDPVFGEAFEVLRRHLL